MVRSEPWLRRKKTRFPQSPTSRWKDFFSYSEEFRARGAALFFFFCGLFFLSQIPPVYSGDGQEVWQFGERATRSSYREV